MEQKRWMNIGINIINSIIAIIFFGFLFYTIHFVTTDKSPLYGIDSVTILKDWTYYDQIEGPQKIETPYVYNREGRDTFVFETRLPDSLPAGSVIAFLNLNDVDISIDGEVIYTWQRDSVPLLGKPTKNSYLFFDIPAGSDGSKLTITRYGTLNSRFLDVFVGKKDAVIRRLESKSGVPNFVLSMFLLIFSFIIFACSSVLSFIFHKTLRLTKMSLGIFVMSSWLFFDSYVFQFVFRASYIDGLMAYICTLCMVFPLLSYLDDLQEHKFRRIYFWIYIVEIINTLTFMSLHLSGIQPFSVSLLYLDCVIFLGIAVAFACTVIDLFRYKNKNYLIIANGFLIFLVFCTVEIIAINVSVERVQGLYILIGLFIMLGFAIAQEVRDVIKIQHERDIATANANARARFLANMSHEIRTPINSILGMNEIIINEAQNPKIESYAKIVNDSGQLLLSIINDILDFSKIDAGKHEIVCEAYHPESVINTICSIMRERAENKDLTASVEIEGNLPSCLYGDSKSLSEILLNLLSNAVKYTERGGISFHINCEQKKDEECILTFVIADTGIGIKESDYEAIFDPFSRTDLNKNRSIQGTGLGLAITKQLVEEMGGTLTVQSIYGAGSTFTVTLPQRLHPEEESDSAFHDFAGATSENDQIIHLCENYTAPTANILIVDDNETNLLVAEALLSRIKANISTADGGYKAFNMCTAQKYDVILMDHMMPQCDGIETLHLVRERDESLNKDTPTIILTANAVKGSEKAYKEEGFDNYLSKPIDSSRMRKMIRYYLPSDKITE